MANEIARKLRKRMTRQEAILWVRLRELSSLGFHFRRQSPIANFIVDFECRRRRLIVEIDGTQHGFDGHRQRDASRDQALNELGYRVMRFGNPEIDRNPEGVLDAIRLALSAPLGQLPPRDEDVVRYSDKELAGMKAPGEDRTDWTAVRTAVRAKTEEELAADMAADPEWDDAPKDWVSRAKAPKT
jgi:very-short-patch-repair endonuclease